MEITSLFDGIYHGRKVLVTGHTGFKGSWLAYWLSQMGAEVYGIALDPPTEPNHLSVLAFNCHSLILDITRREEFAAAVTSIRPEIIFHLAAQPLVRLSYEQPYETYLTNVMGTVNVLEAARHTDSVRAVVIVTSDKCYDNREWAWGYRENEPMGGKDPYSSSKGCAELVTAAYRHSYFHPAAFGTSHNVLVATARAGNVIGGGDWALDRIVPDLVKAASSGTRLLLRYPGATRPWQHVLEPLSGYLMIGWRLLQGKAEFGKSWNFGPSIASNLSVIELVTEAAISWKEVAFETGNGIQPHEAGYLMLDSSLAKKELLWDTVWDFKTTVGKTIGWYRDFYANSGIRTGDDLASFIGEATEKSIPWSRNGRS
ncbi:MAG: CDP-glucose 4,6-dehydratase [Bacteroidota bacterium]